VSDLPAEIKERIKHFFENYKNKEPGKWVKIRDWKGREVAIEEIKKAIDNFK
jgi:inorganic pyrophosphatase